MFFKSNRLFCKVIVSFIIIIFNKLLQICFSFIFTISRCELPKYAFFLLGVILLLIFSKSFVRHTQRLKPTNNNCFQYLNFKFVRHFVRHLKKITNLGKKINLSNCFKALISLWCRWPESNRHALFRRRILSFISPVFYSHFHSLSLPSFLPLNRCYIKLYSILFYSPNRLIQLYKFYNFVRHLLDLIYIYFSINVKIPPFTKLI